MIGEKREGIRGTVRNRGAEGGKRIGRNQGRSEGEEATYYCDFVFGENPDLVMAVQTPTQIFSQGIRMQTRHRSQAEMYVLEQFEGGVE